jgi:hypothetical protein
MTMARARVTRVTASGVWVAIASPRTGAYERRITGYVNATPLVVGQRVLVMSVNTDDDLVALALTEITA